MFHQQRLKGNLDFPVSRQWGAAQAGVQPQCGCREAGFRRLAIMSGIGVRPYYRRQGYERCGPYMIRELS